MKPYLVPTKLVTDAEKKSRTRLEVIETTEAVLAGWKKPSMQRPLRTNTQRFRDVQAQIKEDGVLPGVITLGIVDKVTYMLDGQHRAEAFRQCGIERAYADVKVHHLETMADLGTEWVKLNSQISQLSPDDILRALEDSSEVLTLIRKRCPFVGYDRIRRTTESPLVSMSMILRAWKGSEFDVPSNGGMSAKDVAKALTLEEAEELVSLLGLFFSAWGRDSEYWRLWGSLNVVLCMWLYRRVVLTQYSARSTLLSRDQYRKSVAALSASPAYLEWLPGRLMRDSDRSPAYGRIRQIIGGRMAEEGLKLVFPAPAWCMTHGSRK